MDDQIDPGDNFFGINLSDCVTVAANSPSNAKAIHRAMAFVAEQASQSSGLQGIDQQAIAQGWNNALQAIPIMDSIVGLKAANAHLTRQLAAQALAHAEQSLRENERQCMARIAELEGKIDCLMIECGALKREHDWERKARHEVENQLAAMRVTPATQPTDAQQTVGDVKAAPERRPDGTLKPVARAWEAPKRLTDVRRLGG